MLIGVCSPPELRLYLICTENFKKCKSGNTAISLEILPTFSKMTLICSQNAEKAGMTKEFSRTLFTRTMFSIRRFLNTWGSNFSSSTEDIELGFRLSNICMKCSKRGSRLWIPHFCNSLKTTSKLIVKCVRIWLSSNHYKQIHKVFKGYSILRHNS